MKSLDLYALFSADDKWIGWSFTAVPADSNLRARLVDPGDTPINLVTCAWEGDYHTGKLVDRGQDRTALPQVDESTLIRQKYDQLFREYSIPTVLFMILDQFNTLVEKGQIERSNLDPDFKKLLDHQREIEERYLRTLTHFANSEQHNFVTEQQARQQFKTTFQT